MILTQEDQKWLAKLAISIIYAVRSGDTTSCDREIDAIKTHAGIVRHGRVETSENQDMSGVVAACACRKGFHTYEAFNNHLREAINNG